MLYVIEIKDSFRDWEPAKSLEQIVFAFLDKKVAKTKLREFRDHVRSNKLGADLMRRCKTRYRLTEFGSLGG